MAQNILTILSDEESVKKIIASKKEGINTSEYPENINEDTRNILDKILDQNKHRNKFHRSFYTTRVKLIKESLENIVKDNFFQKKQNGYGLFGFNKQSYEITTHDNMKLSKSQKDLLINMLENLDKKSMKEMDEYCIQEIKVISGIINTITNKENVEEKLKNLYGNIDNKDKRIKNLLELFQNNDTSPFDIQNINRAVAVYVKVLSQIQTSKTLHNKLTEEELNNLKKIQREDYTKNVRVAVQEKMPPDYIIYFEDDIYDIHDVVIHAKID